MSKPIPPLDLAWFLTESPAGPKHVGVVLLFEAPPGRDGIVAEIVAAYRRFKPTPPFNYVPSLLGARMPRFEETADYDPAYHVGHLSLPAGATYESFLALVADLHEPMLDRARPLFRMWAIDGLPGRRFALFLKTHHAIIDGASGAQRIFGSLAASAGERIRPPAFAVDMPVRKARPPRDLVDRVVALRASTAKQTSALKDVYLGALKQGLGALLGSGESGSVPFEAPRTLLNEPLGMARSFATMSLPLGEMRAVGKAYGATLNDVAATIVDAGVHRYLRQTGHESGARLVGMCPISLREAGDASAGTKASAMFVRMGAAEDSVVERIETIVASMAAGKQALRGMSKDAAMLYAIAALGLAELAEATRFSHVARPLANFVLSNVPGSPRTVYLNGARMTGSFPISGLGMSIGLNVTLTSYGDSMDFGFVGNGMALKDLPALARHTRAAYDELKAAATARAVTAPGSKPGRKAAAGRKTSGTPRTAAKTPPPAPRGRTAKRPHAPAATTSGKSAQSRKAEASPATGKRARTSAKRVRRA
jgi:diacylglycerol O-acyltransferase